MKRTRAPLGQLCTLVKGESAISRTVPGQYPLVTTGEEHKTSSTYQLEAEAVCIPLISSTGHGHASLKRVHYACGKFALANLLVAAIVKNKARLSGRFLARYLDFTKDRLIVPLMTGAANMSISIDRLATVPIDFPQLEQQERIVKLLDEADQLRKLRAQADRRTADLIPALFHEMFGDPTLPTGDWSTHHLGELVKFESGGTPSKENPEFWNGRTPWISPKDMKPEEITDAQDHVSEESFSKTNLQLFPKDTVLIVVRGMILIHTVPIRICRVPAAINQDMKALIPKRPIDSTYLCWSLRAQHSQLLSQVSSATHGTKRLETERLQAVTIPVPTIELQVAFAKQVEAIRELEAKQTESRKCLDALFQSTLHRAFQGEL
jgi:type I restriction enzyme, S subunit